MHLLQADCEISYNGRGNTFLKRGLRLIIIKADNSVSIHQDKGIRPINYMTKAIITDETEDATGIVHIYATSNKEEIHIKIYDILFEMHLDFDEDQDLIYTGTEKQLQSWLSDTNHFHEVFGEDIDFVTREYQTTKGAVDLLGRNKDDDQIVLIEVKRNAKRNDVFQLTRYRTAINELYNNAMINGDEFVVTVQNKKTAVPIPTKDMKRPYAYLVASKMLKGVKEECAKQNVNPKELGRSWESDITE